jgi:hypothetical protein
MWLEVSKNRSFLAAPEGDVKTLWAVTVNKFSYPEEGSSKFL